MSMRVANARHVISRTTSDLVVRPLRAPQWMPERSAQPRISSMRIAFRTVCAHSGQYVQEHGNGGPPTWKIKMLYDGDCVLCMREVNMLKRRDEGKGNICFVNIADENYLPEEHQNITFEQAMEKIHAVLPDGTIVTDVAVFRLLYEAVDLGWIYSVTRIPFIEKAANSLYSIWAKYRLPLTGREDLEVLLQRKQAASCRSSQDRQGDTVSTIPSSSSSTPQKYLEQN